MSKYPVGAKVHIEMDGTVVEPYFAEEMAKDLFYRPGHSGWLEVADDKHFTSHVLWMKDDSRVVRLTLPEPEYERERAYMDATGRVYVRTGHDGDARPWLAPSGTFVSDNRLTKPLRKLVPESA